MIPNRDPDMKKRLDFLNQVDFHIQSNSAHLQCLDLAYHNLDRYALAQYHSKHNVSVSIQKKCQGPESNRRHQHFQCCALPTELPWLLVWGDLTAQIALTFLQGKL